MNELPKLSKSFLDCRIGKNLKKPFEMNICHCASKRHCPFLGVGFALSSCNIECLAKIHHPHSLWLPVDKSIEFHVMGITKYNFLDGDQRWSHEWKTIGPTQSFNILHCFCTWNIEQYKINIEFICTIQSYMCDKRFNNELIECISWSMSNVQLMIFKIEFLARWLLHTNAISIYPNSVLCDK